MPHPASQLKLTKELSQVPITALDFYTAHSGSVYVLAGEDARLCVYLASETGRPPVCQVEVFVDQPVHGIRVQQAGGCARVLVWGASSVAIVDAEGIYSEGTVRLLAEGTAPDWIYDAAISPWDPSRAVLATAHNEVVPLTYDSASGGIKFGAATSPSRPMLYAARLRWTSPSSVLIAGGTVFGDVVVWKYHYPASSDDAASHTVLFVLSGHEGSIYGVDMSPEITLADGSTARLLASCSDDRTIRIWDVTERETGASSPAQLNDAVVETGFKSTPSYDDMPPSHGAAAHHPVAVAMGHASRIWGVKFGVTEPVTAVQDGTLPVYSFGEDSTAQRWHLRLHAADGGRSPAGTLKHGQTFSLHNGKHLWAGAVLCRDGRTTIATGGGDSRISLIEEAPTARQSRQTCSEPGAPEPQNAVVTVDVHDILASLPTHRTSSGSREIVSRYDFLGEDQILAVTSLGRLFLGSLGGVLTWDEVDVDKAVDDLKLTYVIRKVSAGAAVLGTTAGSIFYFQLPGRLSHVANVSGRVVEISCLSTASPGSTTVDVLVHLHGDSDSQCLVLDSSTGAVLSHDQVTGLESRFVAVSAARMDDMLLLGSRLGWLSLLTKQDNIWRPILDLPTRSRDAITAIVPLVSKSSSTTCSPYFLATSRDGKYRIYQIERAKDSVRLHLLHETSPPFGPMIEGAWFTCDEAPELVLYGYKSKDFVIWNETRREEVATVDCGGAHRTFRLSYSASEPGRYRFAFTRTSKLSVYSQAQPACRPLKLGTHGREIRALSSNGRYVASGAEDTSIRIWEYCQEPGQGQGQGNMRHLASMKAHVTGIQRLQWFEDEYLFSSAGNEEFFVWRLRTLDAAYAGLALVCEGILRDKSPLGDLRIMDFDVSRPISGHGMLVTLALSNSAVKTYRYSPDGGFEPFAQASYTGACLTQARHLGICGDDLWVVTASTDGHMALWKTEQEQSGVRRYALAQTAQVHQSSIKGLDLMRLGRTYQVMTGGDDNALGVAVISEGEDGSGYTFSTRSIIGRAHAAAINGVVLASRHDKDDIIGVSVSNDQRVKLWKIASDDAQRVELVGSACSGVADAGDVALIRQGTTWRVVVGGLGVEVWSWDAVGRIVWPPFAD
ncbi:Regulator of Ty1 transposition protein 10 [Tolypocladium paradoxum]|uniref:Regulator of Ty1 transposition protein 10 n=1 Tax=Tolypocladium paradoxum TaxID=94208 RepID=A0A2S4L6F6_9HYPO|nr:Regulator of Ty1 transposition protein 10 [Tolypocladium paradoxum]